MEQILNFNIYIDKVLTTRSEQLELFCGALLKEHGTSAITDFELVEQHKGDDIIVWYFRKKTTTKVGHYDNCDCKECYP